MRKETKTRVAKEGSNQGGGYYSTNNLNHCVVTPIDFPVAKFNSHVMQQTNREEVVTYRLPPAAQSSSTVSRVCRRNSLVQSSWQCCWCLLL